MKSILVLSLLLVCSACESKPVQNPDMVVAKATPNGKATPRGTPSPSNALYSAVLEIHDANAPRPIADQLFDDLGIQACLINALLQSGDDFSVSISGLLSPKGVISHVQVEQQNDSLRDCLTAAFPKAKLGKGKSGPFKIEISRSRTTPPAGKTYQLDLNGPKKLQ